MAPPEPRAKPFEQQGEEPFFTEERDGWSGYVEWEKVGRVQCPVGLANTAQYPDKKKQAAEVLAQYDFPVVSYFPTVLTSLVVLLWVSPIVSYLLHTLKSCAAMSTSSLTFTAARIPV